MKFENSRLPDATHTKDGTGAKLFFPQKSHHVFWFGSRGMPKKAGHMLSTEVQEEGRAKDIQLGVF